MTKKIKLPAPEPGELVEDEKAASEELILRKGSDYEDAKVRSAIAKILRAENLESALHKLFLVGLKFGFIAVLAMFGTLVWHHVAPESRKWLKNQQELDQLKQFLFSGTIGAALATLGKRQLGK